MMENEDDYEDESKYPQEWRGILPLGLNEYKDFDTKRR